MFGKEVKMNNIEKEILKLINKLYPLDFIEMKPITNEMYQCLTAQGTYFVRITNYKTYEEQLEEVTYTKFLYQKGLSPSHNTFFKGEFSRENNIRQRSFCCII
ncbi:hypothetical protein ABH964_001346 [Bacillus sp. RC92]